VSRRAAVALVAGILTPIHAVAAQGCHGLRRDREAVIAGGYVAAEVGGIALRQHDWWTSRPRAIHFIWGHSASVSQDEFLHATIAYQVSQGSALLWSWACVPYRTAGWLGAATALAVGLPKEIGDGIHEDGFSGADMMWTAIGGVIPALHRQWPRTRVLQAKMWYWPSRELTHRTGPLPSLENDYAGQRFFATLNPARDGGAGGWPAWLGVAVGHGTPAWISRPPSNVWYLTLDVDLQGIHVHNRWWRPVAALADQIHFPAPGLRFAGGRVEAGLF